MANAVIRRFDLAGEVGDEPYVSLHLVGAEGYAAKESRCS